MNYRKQGLKAFGLSFVAVLGLMAFMAVGAQGAFLYLEGGVTKTLAVESEPTISAHTPGILLVEKKNLKLECKKVESDPTAKVKLLANSTVAHGHLIFKECESWTISPNTLQGKCTPKSTGAAAGEILAGGLAELVLHPASNTMVLFKPLTGKPFATIEFPETCALFEAANVTGSLLAECGELKPANTYVGGNCATHRVEQLLKSVTQALGESQGDILKFGENIALVNGIAAVKFGAPCALCSWGGDAA